MYSLKMQKFAIVAGFFLGFVVLAMSVGPARAVVVDYTFTASGFAAGAPEDPVSGSIQWEAASLTSPIDSLVSIDLSIAGHAYTLGELAFQNDLATSRIGDTANGGISNLTAGTDDFVIIFNRLNTTLPLEFFDYTSVQSPSGVFPTTSGEATASLAPLPEPGTLSLFGLGLMGITAYGRRRRGCQTRRLRESA